MKLWEHIKCKMNEYPYQVVRENEAEMTYEELIIFAEFFAKKLIGEKCCVIFCNSEMASAMALVSCFAAGVTAVPVSARYGDKHCKKIIDKVSPSAIITDIRGELQVMYLSDSNYKESIIRPALIMFTSGTTGFPKGIMLSEENILSNVNDICSYFNIGKKDNILIARPLYHSAVLTGEFIVSLCKGTSITFYSGHFNPKYYIDIIEKEKITVFCGTPTILGIMARLKNKTKEYKLKTICVSGEIMNKAVGRRIHSAFPESDIYHVYGLTEASPRVSYLPPECFEKYPDYVGIPLNAVSIKITKDNGEIAKIGEEGILSISGKNVMLGYYDDPKMTSQVLHNEWLCTGDIALIDKNGFLKIKGRSDDLIIRAGMNIYPSEIENIIKQDPRVGDVIVYGIDNSNIGTQIGMKISGDFTSIEDVKKLCIEHLPDYQVPTHIELLDELPKNESGKLLRGNKDA